MRNHRRRNTEVIQPGVLPEWANKHGGLKQAYELIKPKMSYMSFAHVVRGRPTARPALRAVERALRDLPDAPVVEERLEIEAQPLHWPSVRVWRYLAKAGPDLTNHQYPWPVYKHAQASLRSEFPTVPILLETFPKLGKLLSVGTWHRLLDGEDPRPDLGRPRRTSMLLFAALVLTKTRWRYKNPTEWDHLLLTDLTETGTLGEEWVSKTPLDEDVDYCQFYCLNDVYAAENREYDETSCVPRHMHPTDALYGVERRAHFWSCIMHVATNSKMKDPPRVLIDAYRAGGLYYG